MVPGLLNSLQRMHSMVKPWADWNIYQFLFPAVMGPRPQENVVSQWTCSVFYLQLCAEWRKCHFSVSPILYPQLNVYILWAALKIMVHFTRPSIHAIISFCFWICKPLNPSVKKSILSIYLCIELRLSYHTSYSVSWNEPSTFLWCESSVEHVRSWASSMMLW